MLIILTSFKHVGTYLKDGAIRHNYFITFFQKTGSYVLRNTFISGAGKYRTLCFKQESRTPENKIRSSRASRCCFQLEAALFSIGPTHVT